MNSVSEKIDERILRLLGLEDVFDLDYDTYLTLLKEAIVTGAKKLPEEELAILANERKRIRGKKGRFKPKKEKITANKVATTKLLKGTKKSSELSLNILPQQQDLTGIGKPLQSISKTLASLLKFSKKTNEEDRRDKESQKRTKREEGLEGFKKGLSAVSSAAKKMLAPFQSIIDRIWRFIFFTLLGRAFTQLMDWFNDPKNKRKIDVLGRFLKDWWPTLLGAAVLFFTPFGKFVRTTLRVVGFFAGKLVKAIPQIAKAVASLGRFAIGHPLLTIGATGAAATFAGEMWRQKEEKRQIELEASRRRVSPEAVKAELEKAKRSPFAIFGEAMQNIGSFAGGGSIPSLGNGYGGIDGSTGQRVSGFGPDTQMIVAQPGEIVMNKKTVDAVGADTLLGLNRQYGGPGANKPKMGKLYNVGGEIQRFQNGGIIGGIQGLWNSATSGARQLWGRVTSPFRPKSNNRMGPQLTPEIARRLLRGQGTRLSSAARTMMQEGWSASSVGVEPSVGCAAAIKEVYRRAGISLPWSDIKNQNFVPDIYQSLNRRFIRVKEKERKPGDVVIWRDLGEGGSGINPYGHIGIVMPDGRIANNSTSKGTFTNLNTPEDAKSWWPNTQELIYFRNPRVNQALTTGGTQSVSNALLGSLARNIGKKRGGLIGESDGINIRGATADRQLIAAQPGEFVLPVDTVNRLGVSLLDKLVAMTDSNSDAYLKKGKVRRPQITPLRRGQNGIITLPPITQSLSGGGNNSAAGSRVPAFSAVSPSGDVERSMNSSIYGIVG